MDNRLSHLRTILKEQSLDAIIIASQPSIFYLTNYDGFSENEREAYLLITQKNQFLFTDGRYKEVAKKQIPSFTIQEISRKTPLINLLNQIEKDYQLQTIGFEPNIITVQEYSQLKKVAAKLVACDLSALRIRKDTQEIAAIRNACKIADHALENMLGVIEIGTTEEKAQRELELSMIQQNAHPSFQSIVAFGANASMPHHVPSQTKLKKNQYLLCDLGAKIDGYCSDMTRTIFYGKPTKEQKDMYQTVYDAQQTAIEYIQTQLVHQKPITAKKIDTVARTYIVQKGYPTIPHAIGHGIGIQVHETPWIHTMSQTEITNGMVFSIEPGIYIPGNSGIRIEDLVTIQNNQVEILTLSNRSLLCI